MNHRYKYLLFIFLSLATGVYGQNDSISEKSVDVGEVVVQGSKARSKLKEMHASVTLLTEKVVKAGGIQTLRDISSVAPNFFMPQYGSKLTAPVYIRGIGSRINSPSVGLYVDYVPAFEKASFDFDFFDVERIEVLRGPQGTLYGRNTMGGIINVFTRSPMVYQGTPVRISLGSYGQYAATIGHYRKFSESMAASFSLNYLHNNGFFTNSYSGEKVDRMNSWGGRLKLIKQFSERTTVENIAGFESSRQGGYPYALYVDSLNKAEKINYNQYSYYDRFLFSDALIIDHHAEHFDLKAVTAYQMLDDMQAIDQDFSRDSLQFIRQSQLQHMISQEVILSSVNTGNYKWLFGIYGFHQTFNNEVNVEVYVPPSHNIKFYDHRISGAALFHQSVLRNFAVQNLDVTAGLRLDFENDRLNYKHHSRSDEAMTIVADTVYPALKSLVLLPKIAMNYKLGHNTIYAVAARGYKTGGFNSTFERPQDHSFEPEYSWNYEIGTKFSWFRNKVYTDVALFYIDWDNQQVYQTVPSGKGSMTKNAGISESKGIEFSMRSADIRKTDILVSYGYVHAKFIKYVVDSLTNYNGKLLPYVPAHTLALQLNRVFPTPKSKIFNDIRFSLLFRGTGPVYWKEDNDHSQDFYGLLDARLVFDLKFLEMELWAKNILNTNYEAFYFVVAQRKKNYLQTGRPFNAGITLSLNLQE